MQRSARLVTLLGLLVTASPLTAQPSAPAITGRDVLQRMFDSYSGKWYKTLTFVQKTTRRRADGTDAVQTWYESVRSTDKGTQLRIDIGNLSDGRGMMYTADSVWRVANGTVSAPRPEGNDFLPLIQSVYVQPVSQTAAELTRLGFDLTKAHTGTLEGHPVWIVGASGANDTTVKRFAVDTIRKVLLQMVLVRTGQPSIDVKLDGYVRAGGGWLATKIDMSTRGVPMQIEEYSDWIINPVLPASLFDLTQWGTTPHWARKP